MLQMVPYQIFNPAGKRSNKNKKCDKEYINNLDYTRIEFPITEKTVQPKHKNKMTSLSMCFVMKKNSRSPFQT